MQCGLTGNGGHQPGQPDEDEGRHGYNENEDYDDNGRGGDVDQPGQPEITMDLMRMRKSILMTMLMIKSLIM